MNIYGHICLTHQYLLRREEPPVMLSLETVSCLKTVLRQFLDVLVLVLTVAVLLTTLVGSAATGIRLRHEYTKHAFYDTWTQLCRRLFYKPQSFDAPPQGTLANIPNVPYISRN